MGMMKNIATKVGFKKAAVLLAAVAGVAAIGAAPSQAKADTDFRIGININRGHDHHRHDHGPRYEERVTRVWCPPVYRTECDRVWVPDRYEERQVVRWHGNHRHVECVRVLVERGHWTTVERQVLVSAGHWENRVERVQVADRHDHRHGHRHDHVRIDFGRRW